jgi:hypothetical protein
VESGDLRGWALGSDLVLYQSESRARNAAAAYLDTRERSMRPGEDGADR